MIIEDFKKKYKNSKALKLLFYADDAVLRFLVKDESLAKAFLDICKEFNLILNVKKSKIMYASGIKGNYPRVKLPILNRMEEVDNFNYLGIRMKYNGDLKP